MARQDLIETKIKELSSKNETTDGYSLGDVLLLDKWEKELKEQDWSLSEIELLSPSYYGIKITTMKLLFIMLIIK